ncbi:excalibur calcium-binding domain-containing protein [Campylobacter sp. MOP51]|uniref:excalibur calcium-binding domain-containing protein n=1 Tax=Campylobacter canis TaxID=3378588 RepID=UPI003C4499B6
MRYLVLVAFCMSMLMSGDKIDCSKKYYCSHFKNCDEAMKYLKKCKSEKNGGNQRTDGDNDGVPCESQHCSHIILR